MRENRVRSWKWHERKLEEWKCSVIDMTEQLIHKGVAQECSWGNCWKGNIPQGYWEQAIRVLVDIYEHWSELVQKRELPYQVALRIDSNIEWSCVIVTNEEENRACGEKEESLYELYPVESLRSFQWIRRKEKEEEEKECRDVWMGWR